MYEMAKQAREKMKAKARSLAGEKDQKVDSSDWTPASPLNAEAKTGMRPVSRRAYKSGGKVSGGEAASRSDRKPRNSGGKTYANDLVNRNVKEANELREGVKHIGGMKKGGKIARATGGRTVDGGIYDKKALGAIDPLPKRAAAQHYKKGGRIKRADGGRHLTDPEIRAFRMDKNKYDLKPEDYTQLPTETIRRGSSSDSPIKRYDPANPPKGLKRGGSVKRATGGCVPSKAETQTTEKRIGKEQIVPKRGAAGHYKKGGRTKKADGGFLDNLVNALSGKGYIDGSTWIPKEAPVTASDAVESISPDQYAKERAMARQNMRAARTPRIGKAQADRELAMGRELQRNADIMPGAYGTVQSDRFMKKGGKVKKAGGGGSWLENMVGKPETGSDMSQVGKDQTQRYSQEEKDALNRALRGDDSLPSPDEAAESAARTGDKHGGRIKRKAGGKSGHPDVAEDRSLIKKMVKKNALTGKTHGGRLGKAGGGALELGGESKPKSKKGSKVTDIKINILAGGAGKPPMMGGQPVGGGMVPPGGAGPQLPPALAAAAPPPAMPMGGMPGSPVPGLPGRKSGGRITKHASSYKDMEASSANGEGRLQKTDIAKLHKYAPSKKRGGSIKK